MTCYWYQRGIAVAVAIAALSVTTKADAQSPKPETKTLVVVNGTRIAEHELQSMLLSRGVPKSLWATVRPVFIERLIDDQLMREFLESRKVTAPKVLLDRAVGRVLQQFKKKGLKPDDELKKLGLDEAALRRKLALPIAWNRYARQIVGDQEIREQFKKRRSEFDGTQVRARQIVLKLPKDATAKQRAVEKLDAVRGEIAAGKLSFDAAAKKHSTAPSKNKGGDVGFFAYRGNMPREITRVAFSLQGNEISKPFFTQFGVHLLQVTARKPGQLSLEDARPEIFRQLAQERRNELVAKLRKTATIEHKPPLK